MVNFMRTGLIELLRMQSKRELQNKKIVVFTVGFEPQKSNKEKNKEHNQWPKEVQEG